MQGDRGRIDFDNFTGGAAKAVNALFPGDAGGEESDCRTPIGRNLFRGDDVGAFPRDTDRFGRLVHGQVEIRRRRND